MFEPRFLSESEVLELHRRAVAFFGGDPGVREPHLLKSALGSVEATISGEYLYKSIVEMAAAYYHGIVSNHPFMDGNKRAGLLACERFLNKNGRELAMTNKEAEDLTMRLAKGKIERSNLAAVLVQHVRPLR